MFRRLVGKMDRNEGAAAAIALAAGAICAAAPALVPLVLAAGIAMLHPRADTPPATHWRALAILGAVVIAGLIGGPAWVIASTLIWRVIAEVRAHTLQVWSAPLAALLYRLDAPDLVLLCAASVAVVAWADWAIARLAEWRLGKLTSHRGFASAQAPVLVILLALPTPGAALAALVTLPFVRKARAPFLLRYAVA